MLQLLRIIAFPFSLIYAIVVFFRNRLFDVGLLQSEVYKTTTICVGNLSVGGTGKTPMIEYLIRSLANHKVAVLSRGYKRKSKGFLLSGPTSTVEDLGDEPFQIHSKFPDVAVAVDANRRNGIQKLESEVSPDVILLDDAFQHRWVKPTFSILLTAFGKLYTDDWYLPTGDLRDTKGEANRADLIIVTKCPEDLGKNEKVKIIKKLKPKSHQKVLFSSFQYANQVKDGFGNSKDLEDLKKLNFALVTGIASPEPLVNHLTHIGLTFQHFKYGDHHYFSEDDIRKFSGFEFVLTTEKDYVRLKGRVDNLYYLEISHQFDEQDSEVLQKTILSKI